MTAKEMREIALKQREINKEEIQRRLETNTQEEITFMFDQIKRLARDGEMGTTFYFNDVTCSPLSFKTIYQCFTKLGYECSEIAYDTASSVPRMHISWEKPHSL